MIWWFMTEEEFKDWFIANLGEMVKLGIMHYNADRAKDIRAIFNIVYPELKRINSKLDAIEQVINKELEQKG